MKTYPGSYYSNYSRKKQSTSFLRTDELPADRKEYLASLEYSQGRKIDEVFLINLDSSTDRLARATDQLERANVSFTRFPAVLGYDLDIKYLDTGKVITGKELFETTIKTEPGHEYEVSYNHRDVGDISYKFDGVLAAGELGVTASHVGIWKHALEKGHEHIIIFEDDVVIRDHDKFNVRVQEFLDHLPTNFDVAYIDCHQVEGSRQQLPNNNHTSAVSEDYMAWGTHAAIYSKKGMEKLLKHKFHEAVDIEMWKMSSHEGQNQLISYISEVKMASTKDVNTPKVPSTIDPTGRDQEPNFSQASIGHQSNSSVVASTPTSGNSTIESGHNDIPPAIRSSSIPTEQFDRLLAPHAHDSQRVGMSSSVTTYGHFLGSAQTSSSPSTSYAIHTIMAIVLVLRMCGLQKFAQFNFASSPDSVIQPTPGIDFNREEFDKLLHQSPQAQYLANIVNEETKQRKDTGWTEKELVEFVNSPKFKEAYENALKLEKSARRATEADFGISPKKEAKKTPSRTAPPKKREQKLEKSPKSYR